MQNRYQEMSKYVYGIFLWLLFIDYVTTACPQIDNCITCSGALCTRCYSSHIVLYGYCYECQINCKTCDGIKCTSCKPGKWGNRCDRNCWTEICKNCRIDDGYCLQCKTGLYGSYCSQNCTFCNYGVCDSFQCRYGCIPGRYEYKSGETTSCRACPVNCLSCKSSSECTACKDGFYLRQYFSLNDVKYITCYQCPSSGSSCQSYCLMPYCDKCQIQNNQLLCTECTEGYRYNGDRCVVDKRICSDHCSGHCDINGVCLSSCDDGWTGERCEEACENQCIRCNKNSGSICQECRGDHFTSSCTVRCPSSCTKRTNRPTCNIYDGYCENDCSSGFWGHFCNISCSDGCASSTTLSRICNRNNGKCENGCNVGFTGIKCDTSTTTTMTMISTTTTITPTTTIKPVTAPSVQTTVGNSSSKKTTASVQNDNKSIIAVGFGSGGAVLVLILVSALLIFLLKRRKRTDNNKAPDEWTTNDTYISGDDVHIRSLTSEPIAETQDYIYAKPNKPRKSKVQSKKGLEESQKVYENTCFDLDFDQPSVKETDIDKIELEELEEGGVTSFTGTDVTVPTTDMYYNTASLIRSRIQVSTLLEFIKEKHDYEREFEMLPKGLTRTCNEARKPINLAKNRYNGIYAYDATRVILRSKNFVNSNYIDGHDKCPEYIASLGPTKSTMDNFSTFWEMIWQENTDKIIMLTNLEEGKKMKSEQYWPEQGTHGVYCDYKVTCTAEKVFSEFTVREFEIVQGAETRKVTQFHYTAWPDTTVPDNVASLTEFRDKVEQIQTKNSGLMMVHCSAGVGRTGTYIALDILIKEGRDEDSVDIFGCVNALRGQRVQMVQNVEQYAFLHHCVLYALTCDAGPLPVTAIPHYMTDERISVQHQAFVNMQLLVNGEKTKIKSRKENRKGADIPGEDHRVRLSLTKHDYINAVYLNGYQKANKFIVAQTPLPNTLEDFVSMLYQERCSYVVCLDEENVMDKSVAQYLPPANKVSTFGHFQVACMNSDQSQDVVIRELKISRIGSPLSEELSVFHYQFKSWGSTDCVPPRTPTFLKMVMDVDKTMQRLNCEQPVVVHCITGAERSGLYCAVSILLEKVAVEKELSVLNTICQVCSKRNSAFQDIEHLRFCYNCVEEMLEMSDTNTYYNIGNV